MTIVALNWTSADAPCRVALCTAPASGGYDSMLWLYGLAGFVCYLVTLDAVCPDCCFCGMPQIRTDLAIAFIQNGYVLEMCKLLEQMHADGLKNRWPRNFIVKTNVSTVFAPSSCLLTPLLLAMLVLLMAASYAGLLPQLGSRGRSTVRTPWRSPAAVLLRALQPDSPPLRCCPSTCSALHLDS